MVVVVMGKGNLFHLEILKLAKKIPQVMQDSTEEEKRMKKKE